MTEQERWAAFCAAVRGHWTLVPVAVALNAPGLFGAMGNGGDIWQQIRDAEQITPQEIEQIVKDRPRHL